VIQSTSSLAFP
jgi:hypothetical protein